MTSGQYEKNTLDLEWYVNDHLRRRLWTEKTLDLFKQGKTWTNADILDFFCIAPEPLRKHMLDFVTFEDVLTIELKTVFVKFFRFKDKRGRRFVLTIQLTKRKKSIKEIGWRYRGYSDQIVFK